MRTKTLDAFDARSSPHMSRTTYIKTLLLGAALTALLLAAPAGASSWPDGGGGPGNPGSQPVDPGSAPFATAYTTSGSISDHDVVTAPVVTSGHPATQRVAYGTQNGAVHLQSLVSGDPVGPEGGINVDSGPVTDFDVFTGAGLGLGNLSPLVLNHAGGSRLLILHNDDNQGGTIHDVALAQIDVATGNLLSDVPIPGSDGFTISSAPVLSDPDASGHRYLLFAATNSGGGWLGKVQIANATGSNPTLGFADGLQVNNLNVLASPAIAYFRNSVGTATEYAVVSTAANGNNPTVLSYRVSDLAPGPASANLGTQAQTPSVPLTPAGLNPGSPGSGVATTPAIYVAAGASGVSRVHRLSQTGNSQTLTNTQSTTLTGLPSQSIALDQTTSGGTLSAGNIVASTFNNLYVIDATTLSIVATHSPTSLTPGSTGFMRSEPTLAGGKIFIARDNGDQLALSTTNAQSIMGFNEDAGNASATFSYGRPAVARWYALFVSDRGLFAYSADDTVAPTASLTAPTGGMTFSGTVSLGALAGDTRGIESVVFRFNSAPVATMTSPSSGDPYDVAGAVYSTTFDSSTLEDGTYLVNALATDGSGETTLTSSRIVRVENDAPETTIESGPPASGQNTSPTFEFSSSEGASTFECRIDGAAFAPCDSPYSSGPLALGNHVFEVRASDTAANVDPTPASHSFAIVPPPDTQAPDTTIDSGPAATGVDTAPVFGFSSSEPGSTFECRFDGAAFAPCSSPFAPGELTLGDHTFEVRATDASANTDATPASLAFQIESPPPPRVTLDAINMTPRGQVNLPIACPANAGDCSGVVSLWAWFRVPHTQRDKPAAHEGRTSYRHKRRRRRVGRKVFDVTAGSRERVPMTVGSDARQRACHQGQLRVQVIVRRWVAGEWVVTTTPLVLKAGRCQSS